MSLETEDGKDWPGARTIELGGAKYIIPPLRLRQTIALADVMRTIYAEKDDIAPLADDPQKGLFSSRMMDQYVDVLRVGLSVAYKNVTRDDVLDMSASINELAAAVAVVVEQMGGKKPDAGEQQAASISGT